MCNLGEGLIERTAKETAERVERETIERLKKETAERVKKEVAERVEREIIKIIEREAAERAQYEVDKKYVSKLAELGFKAEEISSKFDIEINRVNQIMNSREI